MSCYLSPLTWGNSPDFLPLTSYTTGDTPSTEETQRKKPGRRTERFLQAKSRQDPPRFMTALQRLNKRNRCFCLPCYSPNPLANCRSPASTYCTSNFVWDNMPTDVDIKWELSKSGAVEGGRLPESRVKRKRQQLENIMCLSVPLLFSGRAGCPNSTADGHILHDTSEVNVGSNVRITNTCRNEYSRIRSSVGGGVSMLFEEAHTATSTVVDFCSGCGHQSIPLAWLFPNCRFILVDMKLASLDIARGRAERLGLSNVTFFHGKVEDFSAPFDLGIALHACGAATDLAQQKCIEARAAYISIPCCVGKVQLFGEHQQKEHSKLAAIPSQSRECLSSIPSPGLLSYPRSAEWRNVLSRKEYESVARAGDFGHHGFDGEQGKPPPQRERHGTDMAIQAQDRRLSRSGPDLESIANSGSCINQDSNFVATEWLNQILKDGQVDVRKNWHQQKERSQQDELRQFSLYKQPQQEQQHDATPQANRVSLNTARRIAKSAVECDRNLFAQSCGYTTWLMLCHPPSCSPKNDIIVGIPTANGNALANFTEWCALPVRK